MTRRPFDPSQASGAESIPGGLWSNTNEPEERPARRDKKKVGNILEAQQITVSQAVELIKKTLEDRLPAALRIVGEVSNFRSKNHWYFSLKDESSVLNCVAWATDVRKFGFTPSDGDEVVATGHISHYGPQGKTQLYVKKLEPVGAGALELKFRQLCEELRKHGYFAEERKRPLPLFPRRVAVITSATGAAIQDVINTAAHRCKAIGIAVVDVPVQGEGAAGKIAKAIRWVSENHVRLNIDAIIVTRGGGSIEDLWAFNEKVVADAAFTCRLPIVAAIGHESDTTVIELVADVRASTPTQAAMRVFPSSDELLKQLEHVEHRLSFLIERSTRVLRERMNRLTSDLERMALELVSNQRLRLERAIAHLIRVHHQVVVGDRLKTLAVAGERLDRTIRLRLDDRPRVARLTQTLTKAVDIHYRRSRDRFDAVVRQLSAVDPSGVLNRGYSMTIRKDGKVVKSAKQVKSGDTIRTHVSDGQFDSVVAKSIAWKKNEKSGGVPQMDLFETSE